MPQDVGSMLDARPAGPAERIAAALAPHGPVAVFAVVLVGAWRILAAAATLLGLLVTDVLACRAVRAAAQSSPRRRHAAVPRALRLASIHSPKEIH